MKLTDNEIVTALEHLAALTLRLTEVAHPADANADARLLAFQISALRAQIAEPEEK